MALQEAAAKVDETGKVHSKYEFLSWLHNILSTSCEPKNEIVKLQLLPLRSGFHRGPNSLHASFCFFAVPTYIATSSSKLMHHYFSSSVPEECTGHLSSSFCRFKSHWFYYNHICRFLYTGLWLFPKCHSLQWLTTSISAYQESVRSF